MNIPKVTSDLADELAREDLESVRNTALVLLADFLTNIQRIADALERQNDLFSQANFGGKSHGS